MEEVGRTSEAEEEEDGGGRQATMMKTKAVSPPKRQIQSPKSSRR
jgi:hypothetical protein